MDILLLHDQLVAACPSVVGVSIGSPADKTTWRVDYDPAQPAPTAAQLAAVQAAIAAFNAAAPKRTYPTPRQWLERLAPATQSAIIAGAASNPALLEWLFKASGSPTIDTAAPETQAGVAALLAANLITAADQAALLAP